MKIKKIINQIKKENIDIDKYIRLREEINDDFTYYSLFEHVCQLPAFKKAGLQKPWLTRPQLRR